MQEDCIESLQENSSIELYRQEDVKNCDEFLSSLGTSALDDVSGNNNLSPF